MSGGDTGDDAVSRATALVRLFHEDVATFARLRSVTAAAVPEPFRGLLDHESHMTVAMERHHGGPVALRVVAVADPARGTEHAYAREILLAAPDGRVVQHGIVRIDLGAVSPAVADRIRAGREPLGRVLVESGALRTVGRVALLAVEPMRHLASLVGPAPTFGRVATIQLSGAPAVELLEIVAG